MKKLEIKEQSKLRNILQKFTNIRKTFYDDNVGIKIELNKREEEHKMIRNELQKIEEVKKSNKYLELYICKLRIFEEIEFYDEKLDSKNEDGVNITPKEFELNCSEIHDLYEVIKKIDIKQMNIIKEWGINVDFLEQNIEIKL